MKPPVRYENGILSDSEGKDIGVAELVCAFNYTWKRRYSLCEAEGKCQHVTCEDVNRMLAFEQDAARYRFLRATAYRTSHSEPPHWCIPETCGLGADFDAAIDEKRRSATEGKG